MIEVSYDTPFPGRKTEVKVIRSRKSKYPWDTMEIGGSFHVSGKSPCSISTQACMAGRRYGKKYSTRTVEGGFRVWRIA